MLVSVIIPVYNAKPYLENLYGTLEGQYYQNLEFIFVNNNSNDGSKELLEKLQKNDARIKIIDEEKQGVSYARKAGFHQANGEYVMFVDADDMLPLGAIDSLVREAKLNQSDMVIGNYEYPSTVDGRVKKSDIDFYQYQHTDVELSHNLKTYPSTLFLQGRNIWNKLYRKDLIKDDFFVDLQLNEDVFFVARAFLHANTITETGKTVYYFTPKSRGLSSFYSHVAISDTDKEMESLKNEFQEYDPNGKYNEAFNQLMLQVCNDLLSRTYDNLDETLSLRFMVDKVNDSYQINSNMQYSRSL